MNIQKQIGMLTFTPEVKRITFNSGQVRDLRDTLSRLSSENERLKHTMRIFARDEVWRVHGVCNPENPNFTGQAMAQEALEPVSEEQPQYHAPHDPDDPCEVCNGTD